MRTILIVISLLICTAAAGLLLAQTEDAPTSRSDTASDSRAQGASDGTAPVEPRGKSDLRNGQDIRPRW